MQNKANDTRYEILYVAAKIVPSKLSEVNKIASTVAIYKAVYQLVEKQALVPWWVVGIIHSLESSLSFKRHLHNGDPLTARTKNVPKGRPLAPPANGHAYEWTESATDALKDRWKPLEWDLPGAFEFLERYNGLGYRIRRENSPYLWAFTQHYDKGKYRADGEYDDGLRAQNAGAAAILKALEGMGKVSVSLA